MDNYYFHSNTQIGENSSLKFRAFYTQFRNDIDMYSNDTYTVMNTKSAEHSMYNEHNDGFSTGVHHPLACPQHYQRFVLSQRRYAHRTRHLSRDLALSRSSSRMLRDADIQTSIGLQDVVRSLRAFSVTGGFSADHFDGLQGQAYNCRHDCAAAVHLHRLAHQYLVFRVHGSRLELQSTGRRDLLGCEIRAISL